MHTGASAPALPRAGRPQGHSPSEGSLMLANRGPNGGPAPPPYAKGSAPQARTRAVSAPQLAPNPAGPLGRLPPAEGSPGTCPGRTGGRPRASYRRSRRARRSPPSRPGRRRRGAGAPPASGARGAARARARAGARGRAGAWCAAARARGAAGPRPASHGGRASGWQRSAAPAASPGPASQPGRGGGRGGAGLPGRSRAASPGGNRARGAGGNEGGQGKCRLRAPRGWGGRGLARCPPRGCPPPRAEGRATGAPSTPGPRPDTPARPALARRQPRPSLGGAGRCP